MSSIANVFGDRRILPHAGSQPKKAGGYAIAIQHLQELGCVSGMGPVVEGEGDRRFLQAASPQALGKHRLQHLMNQWKQGCKLHRVLD